MTTERFFNSPRQQGKIREVGISFLQTNSVKLALTERGRFAEIVFANEQLLKYRDFLFCLLVNPRLPFDVLLILCLRFMCVGLD